MSKKLSGAENRKRRKERDEAELRHLKQFKKVSTYFSKVSSINENTSETETVLEEPVSLANVMNNERGSNGNQEHQSLNSSGELGTHWLTPKPSTSQDSQVVIQSCNRYDSDSPNHNIENALDIAEVPTKIITSSDKGNFDTNLSAEQKRIIINLGPNQPKGPFPKDKEGRNIHRGFDEKWYFLKSKDNIKLKRQWICYSEKLNECYCHPCWLFDNSQLDLKFSSGTSDWAHLGRNIHDHEQSHAHAVSCEVLYRWKSGFTVDAKSLEKIKNETDYWKKVLKRIVDVIITLTTNDLPFREHRLSDDSNVSKGNFLEIIQLLSRYDDVLSELLKRPKHSTKYLSPSIQNELITIILNKIKSEIQLEIKKAPFVSVIVDTTQDISKIDQLSTVFRYVNIKTDANDSPIGVEIKESFCGFVEVSSQKSEDLENVVLRNIEEFTEFPKLRGQGYDGAANMSGIYSGLQARIQEKNPSAKYVHCCGHALNLVVNDSVSNVPEIRQFFDNLQQLYVFFSAVTRWSILNKSTFLKKTLKKVCPTRWSSRIQALDALRSGYFDIMKTLMFLTLNGKDKEEELQAKTLLSYFENFSTVVLIVVECLVLETVNAISKKLQSVDENLEHTVKMIASLIDKISKLRNDWSGVKDLAISLCKKWKIAPTFPEKRIRRRKRMADELQADCPIVDSEKRFQVEVFNRTLDITITQLTKRFSAINDICNNFKCLKPSFLVSANDDDILQASKILVDNYSSDISPGLGPQLIRFKVCFSSYIEKLNNIKDLTETLIVETQVATSFPDVTTACVIFLTMPVSTASAERSFSKLKLIKNYLRSSMSQIRLSSLAIISIERARSSNLDFDEIISQFASEKARKHF